MKKMGSMLVVFAGLICFLGLPKPTPIPPTVAIRLRSEPLTVSTDEAQQVFGLDENWRPLKYIENNFEDLGDIVIDHATGLMWQKSGSDEWLTYEKVQAYVDKLNRERFAGYNDWRLPTIPELMSLLEPEKQSNKLYIDPVFDSGQWWCGSADRGESSPRQVWNVHFHHGHVRWYGLGGDSYVRVVRSRRAPSNSLPST